MNLNKPNIYWWLLQTKCSFYCCQSQPRVTIQSAAVWSMIRWALQPVGDVPSPSQRCQRDTFFDASTRRLGHKRRSRHTILHQCATWVGCTSTPHQESLIFLSWDTFFLHSWRTRNAKGSRNIVSISSMVFLEKCGNTLSCNVLPHHKRRGQDSNLR